MNSDIEISNQIKPIPFNNLEITNEFINIKDNFDIIHNLFLFEHYYNVQLNNSKFSQRSPNNAKDEI